MIKVYFSYDYELLWGTWDGTRTSYLTGPVAEANQVVSAVIKAHQTHQVPATFAIVGAMLDEGSAKERFQKAGRDEIDQARFDSLFIPHVKRSDVTDVNAAALKTIANDDLFELGSHTYSHFYATTTSTEVIQNDFKTFNLCFQRITGKPATSLVLPKNQVTQAVLEIAADYGIKVVRMNPDSWLYRPVARKGLSAKFVRLLRYLDAYLPLLELFPDRQANVAELFGLRLNKGQYFFRPSLGSKLASISHFARLKFGLKYCSLRKRDCHFWSHPHNFAGNPSQAILNLNKLLAWLKELESQGLVSLHRMAET